MAKKRVKIVDRGFKKFIRGVKRLSRRGVGVKIGVQGPEGQESHEGGLTNVDLAGIHELGAPAAGISSRSFIRSTFDENEPRYRKRLLQIEQGRFRDAQGRFISGGGGDPEGALFRLGEDVRKDMIKKIDSNIPPPLQPATIARKKDDLALVDTGLLRASISSVRVVV